jgi:hypothetical protein
MSTPLGIVSHGLINRGGKASLHIAVAGFLRDGNAASEVRRGGIYLKNDKSKRARQNKKRQEVYDAYNKALELQSQVKNEKLDKAKKKRINKQVQSLKDDVLAHEFSSIKLGPVPKQFNKPVTTKIKAREDIGYIVKAYEAFIRKKKQEDEAAIMLLLS